MGNEPQEQQKTNPWIETTEHLTEKDLLEFGHAKVCKGKCGRPIRLRHLKEEVCPDCRGAQVYMQH